MNFTERHLSAISAFLQEIYQFQDTTTLRATICRSLGKLVDGHNIFIGAHDMQRTLITGCVVTNPFQTPDFIEIVNDSLGQHPLWESIREGGAEVRCISNHATAQQWENTGLYREALGLEGVKDHLSIEFGERRSHLASVGVFRDTRGFTDRDIATMRMLMPHLGQALDNAKLAEATGILGDMNSDVVVRIDRGGRLLHVPPEVSAAFAADGGALLTDVCRWMATSAEALRCGALEITLAPLRVRRGQRTFDMRMFHNYEPDGGFRILVRISSTNQPVLSAREWDTLAWLRQGKCNEEIAIILGIKITTVKTHLQHIFRKLGVENRLAATRCPIESIRRK